MRNSSQKALSLTTPLNFEFKNFWVLKMKQNKKITLTLLSCKIILLLSLLNSSTVFAASNSALERLYKMPKASLYLDGDPKYSLRANQPMVPASTLKVLTALLALKTWQPNHRFVTDFYLDKQHRLWVKGYGDPYINSEELDKIIAQLKKRGLKKINGIGIDSHYFIDNIYIDGRSQTNNPYDAPLSALAVNFNTFTFQRNKKGIFTGEKQTPLTSIAKKLAKGASYGKHRFNLKKQSYAPLYFAEILSAKLQENGIEVKGKILDGHIDVTKAPFYRHYNSRTLAEMVSAMLKYSNNFIANQLFLMIGAKYYGAPANIQKSRQAFSASVKNLFGWNRVFYEGAGLSRNTHLTAGELVQILKQFAPYKHLLKSQNSQILAKTGTLTGVSSYAGYLYKNKQWKPFALMINQPIDGNFRKRLAAELLSK